MYAKITFIFASCLSYSSAGSYLFVSHTGFGGVSYAMAIICIRLEAEIALTSCVRSLTGTQYPLHSPEDNKTSGDEARKMGDYRDILSLTRVLLHGPESKVDVDIVIERYAILFAQKA